MAGDVTAPLCSRGTIGDAPMLELRPNCECCDKDLPPESTEARICSFECTFCVTCVTTVLKGKCPNCGGELVARPRRPAEKLAKYPASVQRVLKPQGCPGAA
jgi:hypothetical protein